MIEITGAHMDALTWGRYALEGELAEDVALYMRLVGHYRNGRVTAALVQTTADRINRCRDHVVRLRDLERKLAPAQLAF